MCILLYNNFSTARVTQCWREGWLCMLKWEGSIGRCGLLIMYYPGTLLKKWSKTTTSMLDKLATGFKMKCKTWTNVTALSAQLWQSVMHRISWYVQRHNVWLCFTILSHYTSHAVEVPTTVKFLMARIFRLKTVHDGVLSLWLVIDHYMFMFQPHRLEC